MMMLLSGFLIASSPLTKEKINNLSLQKIWSVSFRTRDRYPAGPPHFALTPFELRVVNQKNYEGRIFCGATKEVCPAKLFRPPKLQRRWGRSGDIIAYMYYVYILSLENKQYYIGYTTDLQKRYKRHFQSSTKTTTRIKPVKLEFYAAFSSKLKAQSFEKYLKSSSGFAFRNKRLISGELKQNGFFVELDKSTVETYLRPGLCFGQRGADKALTTVLSAPIPRVQVSSTPQLININLITMGIEKDKQKILIGLKKAESLLKKITSMVEGDGYCVDIMQQNLAVIGLLRSVHSQVMKDHLSSCFIEGMNSKDRRKQQQLVEEIIKVNRLVRS